MALVILDNSLLQVLTTVQRLDLLASHAPLLISRGVHREHERCAPSKARKYLRTLVDDGFVEIRTPRVQTDHLQQRYRALSPEDAEGLAWALERGAFLLTEDRRLLEAAEAEGADWVELPALLMACRSQMGQEDMAALVTAVELDADHQVSQAVKARLGI